MRNVIHYGWPQSLEQYFQEAGRAGRDGKRSNCVLFADLSNIPSLLPSKCSAAQTQHKLKALKALYFYALRCNSCRVRQVLEYFGENWSDDIKAQGCGTCDACIVGVYPEENYFEETGTMLESIEQNYPNDRQSMWTELCKDLQGKCNRGKHFWRGLCRQLIELGYVVDDGMPSASQQRNSVNSIACPQPTARGVDILRAWQRLNPAQPSTMAGGNILGRGLDSDRITLGSGTALKMPFKTPRQGLQADLGSWRVLASLTTGETARQDAPKLPSGSDSSNAAVGATASRSDGAVRAADRAVMIRPEGDMLPAYEKARKSPWADSGKRAEMLTKKWGGKKGGKKGRKRKGGKSKGGWAVSGKGMSHSSNARAFKAPRSVAKTPKFKKDKG